MKEGEYYQKCFLEKALPEPDLRYISNFFAFSALEKTK
jgi:hypothetical protein